LDDGLYTLRVASKRDKRRRSDLRAFVIALLLEGVSTPYEMQSLADLSPGATIPILQSLVEHGHVRAGKPGTRGRVAYVVTSKGKKWLEEVWPSLLQDGPSGDLDSDLRVFLIAIRVGKDRARAQAFLRNAIAHRQETLAELDGKMKEEGSRVWLADQYVSLRARASAAILKAEAKAIDSILDGLRGGLPIAKRARAR
jgi:DNA-binding PadR family transcriptional regulator